MSLVDRLFAPARPSVAVEIASTRVAALRLAAGSPPAATHAVEPLPQGAVVPGLTATNIVDQAVVVAAITRVLQAVGGSRRVALVVPDALAKVSLVRFDQVPARTQDLEAMLRWQVRKSVPFRADEAQVTWVDGEALPADLSGARRLTYARLAALAATHNLAIERRSYSLDEQYRGRLQRLVIAMTLSGEYRDVRAFLYAVETAPEFVTIEDVGVAESSRAGGGLAVGIRLATYFPSGASHGL